MRVLLVENDAVVARGISLMLRSADMITDVAATGEETLELASLYDYDIVVLDSMLSDMEGCDVIRRLRSARIETPVLVLCGLSGAQPRVRALSSGADDVLNKPFDPQELMARIQAIVRRSRGFSQPTLVVGPLSLNIGARQARVNGQMVPLTGKEYAILELLTLRKGMALSRDVFLNHLYGGIDEPEGKIIDVFVCKLRRKLADAGADGLIGTHWGSGYVLREVRAPMLQPFSTSAQALPAVPSLAA
ncbi:response regulator transcription factor [Teichococcus vastitatis]|jgi:two-component system cell cycle response regulator CtrA|uniref:Response regulator transcription factor n=1 Tax=Teichococcus vastitatis TaxID=2307076 RepID=A0ABS9VZX8_9PROT|nr:response regulator transcription factor [Pseudoroseomonas vastitatis]MCI0752598.1 response regulator transcription factor [Pseudoroseomonas vastitatis]